MKEKTKIRCLDCMWVDQFYPRADELTQGLVLGCKKLNWECYTKDLAPSCDGVFFRQKDKQGN